MTRSKLSVLNSRCLFSLFFALAWGKPVYAQELGEGVQAHGFISQSFVHTSDNHVGGDSDDGVGLKLREMGANLSWRPDPDWLISGQVLARWAGDTDEGKLRLDYGFVDRAFYNNGDTQVGLRLGKIKNPYGFYNATRDVAHTRPGIIMPQSIYLDQIRNFFLAAPGFSLYGNSENPSGNLSWQFSALRPEVDEPSLEYVFLLGDRPGHFQGDNSWLGQAMYDMGGSWRIGMSLGQMNMSYKPRLSLLGGDELAGSHHLPTWVLSLEHNTEKWSLTSEYGQTRIKAKNYFVSNTDHWTEAWYVQATRRFSNGWQGFARYDVLFLDKDDKDGLGFVGDPIISSLGFQAHSRYSKDWVLGIRRDIDRLSLSAEFHFVNGTAWLAQSENPPPNQVGKWNMVLLQAAWRF